MTRYRTTRPLWEDVAGYLLAVFIGVFFASLLFIGCSS